MRTLPMSPAIFLKHVFAAMAALIATGCGEVETTESRADDVQTIHAPPLEMSERGWRALFNGQDLDGWRDFRSDTPPNTAWRVEDGLLVFRPDLKVGTEPADIMTVQAFSNFDLKLEWKISKGGNNGVFFHVQEDEAAERISHAGLEMQILDDALHRDAEDPRKRAGAAYDLYAPKQSVARPAGEWNEARIRVEDGKVIYWLNERRIVEYDLNSQEWAEAVANSKHAKYENFSKVQNGRIGFQDHSDVTFFRNIYIRPIDRAE